MLCLATWIGGCGQASTEHELERAHIAQTNNQPELAIEIAARVLAANPDDARALRITAMAQLGLGRLEEARQVIDHLRKAHPDDLDGREAQLEWTWAQLRSWLDRSDFVTDKGLGQQYVDLISAGREQARWFIAQGSKADGHYYMARLAAFDSLRVERELGKRQGELRDAMLAGTTRAIRNDTQALKLRKESDALLDEASRELTLALVAQPYHDKAVAMAAPLLVRLGRWDALFELAQSFVSAPQLSADTAEKLVDALLATPKWARALDQRAALAWKIQYAVIKEQQENSQWKNTGARLYQAQDQWDKAQVLLDAVLAAAPGNMAARYNVAFNLYSRGKHQETLAILEKLLTDSPGSPSAKALYGLTLMHSGDRKLARTALADATRYEAGQPMATHALLIMLAEEGQLQAGLAYVEEYIEHHLADADALRVALHYYMAVGQRGRASDLLDRAAIMPRPNDAQLALMADGYVFVGQLDQARAAAATLLERQPGRLEHYLRLAQIDVMHNNLNQARAVLESARQQAPEAPSVDAMLARLYLQTAQAERALPLAEAVVRANPNDIEAHLLLAQALAATAFGDQALEQVDEALGLAPTSNDALALGWRIAAAIERPERAEQYLARVDPAAVDPDEQPVLAAQIKLLSGQPNEARRIAYQGVLGGQADPLLRIMLARLAQREGDLNSARTQLLALIHLEPNNPQVYNAMARFYLDQQDVRGGSAMFESLEALNPRLARATMASMLMTMGQPEAAAVKLIPLYRKLLGDGDPSALEIADEIARIYRATDQPAAAVYVYDDMIKAGLRTEEAMLRQVDGLVGMGRGKQAYETLERLALNVGPDKQRIRQDLLRRYAVYLGTNAALTLLDQWAEQEPDNATLLQWRGQVLMKGDRPVEAAAVFNLAIKLAPDFLALRLELGRAYEASLDFPNAQQAYQQAAELGTQAKVAAFSELADMNLRLGLFAPALALYHQLHDQGMTLPSEAMLAMGRIYWRMGQAEMARRWLEAITLLSPQYASAQITLADLELGAKEPAAAKQRFTRLARNSRTVPTLVQEMLDRNPLAEETGVIVGWIAQGIDEMALPADSRAAWLKVRYRQIVRQADWQQALDTLTALANLEPATPERSVARIVLLVRMGQREQATELWRGNSALQDLPVAPLLQLSLAGAASSRIQERQGLIAWLVAMANGQVAQAQRALDKAEPARAFFRQDLLATTRLPDATALPMQDAYRQIALGVLAQRAGLPAMAQTIAEEVLTRLPELIPAHALRAESLLDRNLPTDQALAAARQAIPDSALTKSLTASAQALASEFDAAAGHYQALLQREPDNDHLLFLLAQVHYAAKRFDEAIKALEPLTKHENPYRSMASNDLAFLLAQEHPDKLNEARQVAGDALALMPNNPYLLDTLGWIEHLRGNDQEALTLLCRSLVNLPLPQTKEHVAVVYEALGQNDWAKQMRQAAKP